MIPKTIYRMWFSEEPIPEIYRWTRLSFYNYNPDCKVIDLRLSDIPKLYNQTLFDNSPFNARKADIARPEIIYDRGGIYADMDIVCLKNLDPILKGPFTGMGTENEIGNAFFGAPSGSKWLLDIMVYFREHDFPTIPKTLDEYLKSSLGPFHHVTPQHNVVTVYPREHFYPVPPEGRNNINKYDLSNSYTLHLWHGSTSWIPQYMNMQHCAKCVHSADYPNCSIIKNCGSMNGYPGYKRI